MKREDPILALTMTRSKARVHGLEKEEGAQDKGIAFKVGNTNDEIDNFTLGLEDMEASPTQAQPQE